MRDADALPALVAVMTAAGHHDAGECLRLLDVAEVHLGPRFHQSRADLVAAREAVDARDWQRVWRRAWSATTGLTWAFPPDLSTCPPLPGPVAYPREGVRCGCGVEVRADQAFCAMCGAPLS